MTFSFILYKLLGKANTPAESLHILSNAGHKARLHKGRTEKVSFS